MSAGDFTPGASLDALRIVVNMARILNRRPRPVCRDCADLGNADGSCPNTGLPCDALSALKAADEALAALSPSPSEAAGDAPVAAHGMRAAFMAWAKDQGCDTDGAWSAWQACWNMLHTRPTPAGAARPPMTRIAGVNAQVLERAAIRNPPAPLAAPHPAPQVEVRMLTEDEAQDAYALQDADFMEGDPTWMDRITATIRKFCDVNGLTIGAPQPAMDLSDVPVPRENSWQRPSREWYADMIQDTQQAEDAAGGVLAAGGAPHPAPQGEVSPDSQPHKFFKEGEVVKFRFGAPGPDVSRVRVDRVHADGFFDGYDLDFNMPLTRVDPALCAAIGAPQGDAGGNTK